MRCDETSVRHGIGVARSPIPAASAARAAPARADTDDPCLSAAFTTPPETTSALLEHPAPNLEPGDVLVLADGREGLVTRELKLIGSWAVVACSRLRSRRGLLRRHRQLELRSLADDLKDGTCERFAASPMSRYVFARLSTAIVELEGRTKRCRR